MLRSLSMSIFSALVISVLAMRAAAQFTPPTEVPIEDQPVQVVEPLKIDPNTPLDKLLPPAPKTVSKIPAPFNDDLSRVPVLAVAEPISKTLQRPQAITQMANRFDQISFMNKKKQDGFLLTMLDQRPEMHGLPYVMGDACHTDEAKGRIMPFLSETINRGVADMKSSFGNQDTFADLLAELQTRPTVSSKKGVQIRVSRDNEDAYYRALVAAEIQILGPESEAMRTRLARSLATIPHIDATKALAQLAIFAPEQKVRDTAIAGLKLRRERDYTDVLMQGFQYPLPEVSKYAAEALIALERKDVLENLVSVLDQPDPRMPVTKTVKGKEVTMLRELARVNHHHNCTLCHAPASSGEVPEWALKVGVPMPGDPFPSEGGYNQMPRSQVPPNIFVRIDMTYLKQDFSRLMPVANPAPWPTLQRFDFFVRTRELTTQEAKAWQDARPTGLTPYQQSALLALRELTGRDTDPTAAAWRTLLKTRQ